MRLLTSGLIVVLLPALRAGSGELAGNERSPAPQEKAALEELQENWAGFRGPGGSGVSAYTNIPSSFDVASGRNVLWKASVPEGISSPIVWGNTVFVSASDGRTDQLLCISIEGGKELWRQTLPVNGEPPRVNLDLGFAGSTPVTDGERVYVIFASGNLAAIDFAGKTLWSKDYGPLQTTYGYASSPVISGNLLILQMDVEAKGQSQIVALESATGKEVWRKTRPVKSSWTTPAVVRHKSRDLIITTALAQAFAYDAKDGGEVWNADGLDKDTSISPVCAGGRAFLVQFEGKMAALALDSSDEAKAVWVTSEGTMPEVCSPVSDGKQVFLISPSGTLQCFNAADGKLNWLRELDLSFYSSPSLVGDRLFLISKNEPATVIVAPAGGGEKPLVKSDLGEACSSCPAFQEGRMYIRGMKTLFCIGETKK